MKTQNRLLESIEDYYNKSKDTLWNFLDSHEHQLYDITLDESRILFFGFAEGVAPFPNELKCESGLIFDERIHLLNVLLLFTHWMDWIGASRDPEAEEILRETALV